MKKAPLLEVASSRCPRSGMRERAAALISCRTQAPWKKWACMLSQITVTISRPKIKILPFLQGVSTAQDIVKLHPSTLLEIWVC